MPTLITSISGIRGIPGDSLLPDTVIRYAAAFAVMCDGGTVVVGYDGRPSGLPIKDLVSATLRMAGCAVIDIGLAPTPTVQVSVERAGAAGGVAITASHNPSEWNGLKFLDARGVFLDVEQNATLFTLADAGRHRAVRWDAIGTLSIDSHAVDRHIDLVLTSLPVHLDAIRACRFSVVVDAVNASGSMAVPTLLERLGCTVHPLYCDGTGRFPHTPEPLPVNLTELGRQTAALGADLGVAVDPDADRLVLFTEEGRPFGEEYTVTTATDALLARLVHPDGAPVVVNLSTTRAVDDVAARYGARVERTPVGEINVARHMLAHGAPVGGEGSGGVIVPAVHAGRDSLVGLVLTLDALARTGLSASAYRATLPDYVIRKSKYATASFDMPAAFARVATAFAGERINADDGLRIDFAEGWVHIRTSNTEPIARVIAEASTAETADALAARVAAIAFGPEAEPHA